MADLPQTNYVVTAQMQIRPMHGRSRLSASRMLVLEIIKAFRGGFYVYYYRDIQHERYDSLIECTRFLYCRLNLGIEDVCHTEHKKRIQRGAGAGYF